MITMEQTMRWFGPKDPVSLADIRQAGCTGIVTALHHIPIGDVWAKEEIEKRNREIQAAGLTWSVIESLPIHDDLKRGSGNWRHYIDTYVESLRNIAACGPKVVTYNFMPVLDWSRTDIAYVLPDGSEALRFEREAFAVLDLFILERPGAQRDYSQDQIDQASTRFNRMSREEREVLSANLLLGLPGSDVAFTPEHLLSSVRDYENIDREALKANLFEFLRQVTPVAADLGLKMAIHPDDPPFPILGLPRVVSTQQDLRELLAAAPNTANGLCFCTGSLGSRPDNDLVAMLRELGDRIHFLHLRNTKRDEKGNFYEADHLTGDTNMAAVLEVVSEIMNRKGSSIPMRPDHGHRMLGDLQTKAYPGYTGIGRLKGLAELRGLEMGINYRRKTL